MLKSFPRQEATSLPSDACRSPSPGNGGREGTSLRCITITLQNVLFGSDAGGTIPVVALEMRFSIIDERILTGDVNRDGAVNILDLIRVARLLDQNAPANAPEDVNRDGVVNVLDLVFVANQF